MAAIKKMKRYSTQELKNIYKQDDIINKINNIEKVESSVCRSKFKILIINDNVNMANQTKRLIKSETDFDNVFTTNSLYEAKDLLSKLEISLVLTCYRMGTGDEDCYDLFKYINKKHKHTSMIMISGVNTETERMNLKKAGVPVLGSRVDAEILANIVQCAYVKFLDKELDQCLQ